MKSPGKLDAVHNETFRYDSQVSVDVLSESEVADLPPIFSWENSPLIEPYKQ